MAEIELEGLARLLKKRVLKGLLILLAAAGFLAFLYPFSASLQPTDKAHVSRPSAELKNLSAGSFIEVTLPDSKVFVVRGFDDSTYVHAIPFWRELYWVSGATWERLSYPCERFGPEVVENKLVVGGVFRCHDDDNPLANSQDFRWDYSGKGLSSRAADMTGPAHEIIGSTIYMNP